MLEPGEGRRSVAAERDSVAASAAGWGNCLAALFRSGPGRIAEIAPVDLPHPRWEYNVRADPRAITVSVWTNHDGWPVEIRTTGQAASSLFSVTETFGNYNKSLSISKP